MTVIDRMVEELEAEQIAELLFFPACGEAEVCRDCRDGAVPEGCPIDGWSPSEEQLEMVRDPKKLRASIIVED